MFVNISAFFYFFFSVIGVYVIFMPKILQELGYSTSQIGIIFAIAPMVRFLIPFLFLKLFSLSKKVLNFALAGLLISAILFYITIDNFYLFLLANFLFGLSSGLLLPYIETFALEFLEKKRFGRSRLFGSIGFMLIGEILASLLLDNPFAGIHLFFITIFLTTVFAYKISQNSSDFKKREKLKKNKFNIFDNLPLWISIFLMQMSFGAFYQFFTIYENEHGIDLQMISHLWTFGILCEIVLFYYQNKFLKYNLYSIIKFTTFVTSIRWLLLYLFPNMLIVSFISQSFHALSFALYHTATLSYLYSKYENKTLATQFYYGFGFGLGGFVGSLIAGKMYGEYLYLMTAIIAFISFAVLYQTQLKKHKFK